MNKIVILGSGGYGRTIGDLAKQLEYEPVVLDDASIHHCCEFTAYDAPVIPAFGDNELRLKWCKCIEEADKKLAALIHPTSYVSPTAVIMPGTVILPHAIVNTDVIVGKGCIINLGAIIDHGCIIEDGVHICIGAIVKGENRIPKGTKIEAGTIIERGQYPL